MSEKEERSAQTKFPTAVWVTGIICGTVLSLSIAGMIFSWAMVDHIADKLPDNFPEVITINHNR